VVLNNRLSSLSRRFGAVGIWGVLFCLASVSNAYAAGPGPDACKGCHEDAVASYTKSIHGQKGHANSPASAGDCSSCHGDGTAHVKANGGKGVGGIKGFNNKAISAKDKSETCLACHTTTESLTFWDSGKHKRNDVSCNDCHSVHTPTSAGNPKMLKVKSPSVGPITTTTRTLDHEVCNSCHRDKRGEILKPSHHPVVEGKVKCADCHNPHGTMSKAMLKGETVNDLCLTCHTDKRGPFIHEHAPVEENCLICHNPHGSQHNRLLTEKAPRLCGNCHANGHTHGLYDARSTLPTISGLPGLPAGTTLVPGANVVTGTTVRFEASGCINCHRQIHGSNAPGRGAQFVR